MSFKNLIFDNLYLLSKDVKDDFTMTCNEMKKKKKKKYKIKSNVTFDILVVFGIAILITIIIMLNNFKTNVISVNTDKVLDITFVNYINDMNAKMMIIDDKDGIKKIKEKINELKRIDKPNDLIQDSVFDDNSKDKLNDDYIILIIKYKKKTDILKVYNDHIEKNEKIIFVKENNLETLWYTLNYNVEEIDINKLNELLK